MAIGPASPLWPSRLPKIILGVRFINAVELGAQLKPLPPDPFVTRSGDSFRRRNTMPDKYPSMRALYADPMNVEGTTYGKRWKRHEWIQLVEAQAIDNPETEKVVLAIHGGGIEGGTSEVSLAVAGFHPAAFAQATDGLGFHDLWIFEGLLSSCNSNLHVTSTEYDDPIALELVQNARRCISLHGFGDADAGGKNQIGGLDSELKSIVLEELTAAGIPAHIATDPQLNGPRFPR
jgi:hypothetical protein